METVLLINDDKTFTGKLIQVTRKEIISSMENLHHVQPVLEGKFDLLLDFLNATKEKCYSPYEPFKEDYSFNEQFVKSEIRHYVLKKKDEMNWLSNVTIAKFDYQKFFDITWNSMHENYVLLIFTNGEEKAEKVEFAAEKELKTFLYKLIEKDETNVS